MNKSKWLARLFTSCQRCKTIELSLVVKSLAGERSATRIGQRVGSTRPFATFPIRSAINLLADSLSLRRSLTKQVGHPASASDNFYITLNCWEEIIICSLKSKRTRVIISLEVILVLVLVLVCMDWIMVIKRKESNEEQVWRLGGRCVSRISLYKL